MRAEVRKREIEKGIIFSYRIISKETERESSLTVYDRRKDNVFIEESSPLEGHEEDPGYYSITEEDREFLIQLIRENRMSFITGTLEEAVYEIEGGQREELYFSDGCYAYAIDMDDFFSSYEDISRKSDAGRIIYIYTFLKKVLRHEGIPWYH